MASEIDRYISKRYHAWLDYSTFHAGLEGFAWLAQDLLHTVLLNVLQKPQQKLIELYHRKKQGYTELDFFILAAIKLNAHSATSPFRYNEFEKLKYDLNIDLFDIEISDLEYEEDIFANRFLSDLRLLRLAIEKGDLTSDEKIVCNWKLLFGSDVKEAPVNKKQCMKYRAYKIGSRKVIETYNRLKFNE